MASKRAIEIAERLNAFGSPFAAVIDNALMPEVTLIVDLAHRYHLAAEHARQNGTIADFLDCPDEWCRKAAAMYRGWKG